MELQSRDTELVIKITHGEPIEMKEFAKSMNAFSELFSAYCAKNADSTEGRKAKLYIRKIEQGCIELRLQEIITALALPFVENMNLIFDFGKHLKDVFGYFCKGEGDKPKLTASECRLASDAIGVVADDNHGEMTIYNIDARGGNFHNCVFVTTEANAGQNKLHKEAERIKEDDGGIDVVRNALMTVYQMREDMSSQRGNMARIDAVCSRPLPVRFANEDLQNRILGSNRNPIKLGFEVDAEVQTAEGRPALYRVLALHDVIEVE